MVYREKGLGRRGVQPLQALRCHARAGAERRMIITIIYMYVYLSICISIYLIYIYIWYIERRASGDAAYSLSKLCDATLSQVHNGKGKAY